MIKKYPIGYLGYKQRELGQWYYSARLMEKLGLKLDDLPRKVLWLGIFKFSRWPKEGEAFSRVKHYAGFMLEIGMPRVKIMGVWPYLKLR